MNQAVKLKLIGTEIQCLVLKLHGTHNKSLLKINTKS